MLQTITHRQDFVSSSSEADEKLCHLEAPAEVLLYLDFDTIDREISIQFS